MMIGNTSTPPSPGQPSPTLTRVARLPTAGGVVATAIMRVWPPGSVGRCSLCDACTIDRETRACMVLTSREVPPGGAGLFQTRGRPLAGGSVPGRLRVFDPEGGPRR